MPTRLQRRTIRIIINRRYRHINGADGAVTKLWTTYLLINQCGCIEAERPIGAAAQGVFMVCVHANARSCYVCH